MYNSSVDFVVKSIQKLPLVNLDGLIYQEYHNFFEDIWLEKIKNLYHLYNFDSRHGVSPNQVDNRLSVYVRYKQLKNYE